MSSRFALSAVLLVLIALQVREAQSHPVRTRDFDGESRCTVLAKAVISAIGEVLNNSKVFHGFNCTDMTPMTHDRTTTASACAPSESGITCAPAAALSSAPRSFNETYCLLNMRADMEHYKNVLGSYLDADQDISLIKMVKAVNDMLEQCSWPQSASTLTTDKLCATGQTFNDRKCLCGVMQGFQLRALTIGRALGYIDSRQRRK